ncbi:MAG: hypothetical protein COA50_06845 [Flavobacteriaceae bacterium]|nr:MAG: hypothetical protein COA50_06845 [Flavobacteriaceae bacterium]
MTKGTIYRVILCLVLCLSSCDKNDLDHQNEYDLSLQTWLDLKALNQNTYEYTVTYSSWVGFSWETTITVQNGIIVKREFEYVQLPADFPDTVLQWTKSENEIGTYENGAAPLTLDQVYEIAAQEWLINRKNAKTYLETNHNGLISSCGYVENGCSDDCFVGIHIKSIFFWE